jgi:endogenous inhibitor of DNA gyrase (YacG/DUF329 family)
MTASSQSHGRPCPICRKPRSETHAPFCSTRCKDRDLVRWFSDGYSVPGPPLDPESIDATPD